MPHRFTAIDQLHVAYQQIYLSPHLDDVALSCGGAIARAVSQGQHILVVNVCSGEPDAQAGLSDFAQENHQRWGLNAHDAVAQRLHEDVEAFETLGVDGLQLDELDAIYRMPADYISNDTLFGNVAPNDPLQDRLFAQFNALWQRYPDAIFYAPLAVGNHVDHQICFAAARGLLREGASVTFYEDIPYVLHHRALETRLDDLGGASHFLPSTIDIDAFLARKISAIECYTSQMSSLFGDAAAMAQQIRAYAEGLRPDVGTHGERIWLLR